MEFTFLLGKTEYGPVPWPTLEIFGALAPINYCALGQVHCLSRGLPIEAYLAALVLCTRI